MADVLDLADDAIKRCGDLEDHLSASIVVSGEVLAEAINLNRKWLDPASGLNAPRRRLAAASLSLVEMAQDFQIQLLPARASNLMRSLQLPPLSLQIDSFIVTANQIGRVGIDWNAAAGYHDIYLFIPIELRIASQPAERLNLRIPIALQLQSATDDIGFVLAGEPSFIRAVGGEATDPIRTVPARRRGDARDQLRSSVRNALAGQTLSLDKFGIAELGIAVSPIACSVRRSVMISARAQKGRKPRAKAPMDLATNAFDQSVTLRDRLILGRVDGELRRHKANLTSFTLRSNRIEIEARRTENRRECHVEVEVKVELNYNLYVQEDMPADLFVAAYMSRWAYEIDARNCWPVCRRVHSQATKETMREIEKVKFLTFHFSDLRSVATRAVVSIQPSGLTILMKGR